MSKPRELGDDLSDADLGGADLSYSDFRVSKNLDPGAVTDAKSWDKAFYDDEMLKTLGLPPDHNAKLAEQQQKEK